MARKHRLVRKKSRRLIHACECSNCRQFPNGRIAREHRALNRLIAAADERTRRLLAGFLARQQGKGGIALLARITGSDRNTMAVDDVSCASLAIRRALCDDPALGARTTNKKSAGPERPGGVAQGYGGREPDSRPEVDPSVAPQTA